MNLIGVTNNITLTNYPLVTDHYFDPAVEFLELGVNENSKTSWKIIGPDFDGRYGSQNGTGGFEAVASGSMFSPIAADAFGNVLATLSGVSLSWNSSRVSAYGSVPGYRSPALGGGRGLASEYAWRNRTVESIGFVWLGGNWLDPVSGRLMTFDPLGFEASDTGYTFCRGNPINLGDADGMAPQLVGVTYDLRTGSTTGNYYDPGYMLFPTPSRGGGFPQMPPRVQGGFMMLGGGLEAGGSIMGAAALSPSVVGSIPFVAAAAQGGGLFGAGLNQVITGERTRTPTSQALDVVTGNPRTSDLLDTGIGMGLSFYTGAARYRGVVLNTGGEGNAWLLSRAGDGAVGEFRVATDLGTRRLDVYAGTLAQESKVGAVANSTSAYTQLLKDEDILSRGLAGVQEYEWHLFRSAETGAIGMAPNLMSEAERIGIDVIQHGGSGWSAAEALFGPTAFGLSYNSGSGSAITLSKH